MPPFVNRQGERYGMLEVLSRAENIGRLVAWLCRCDCGEEKVIRADSLHKGAKSCGCLRLKTITTHNMTHSAEYKTWWGIKYRCSAKHGKPWKNYGSRGIKVCDRWRDSFTNFLVDMGKRPGKGFSIERIDNNKGYSPSNCKWATVAEQNRNRRLPSGS